MDNILYKYLDCESGKKMLCNSNLQFTQTTKLNDPFDCYPNLLDFTSYEKCYKKETGKLANQIEEFEKLRESIIVCSLSKTHESLLMWSYYNQHKGICIGLDMQKVLECLKRDYPSIKDLGCPIDVKYLSEFKKLDYESNQSGSFCYIFQNKAKEWEHEEEVRMLANAAMVKVDGSKPSPYFADGYWRPKIDGACFTSIYLGVNICEDDKSQILNIACTRNPQIKVFQMKTNPNAFKLDSIIVE